MSLSFKRLLTAVVCLSVCFSLFITTALSAPTSESQKVDASKQNAITAYALSFEGNTDLQYVWGGYGGRTSSYKGESGENAGHWSLEQCIKYSDEWSTNPEHNAWKPYGTDCSGFVAAVFQHFKIPVESYDLFNKFPRVSPSEAVPGDIVCYKAWDEERKVKDFQHVGLYLGDGLIVHISTRYGYTGRTTPFGGYATSARKKTPTFPHVSKVDYWTGAELYYFRVVSDWSKYPIKEETGSSKLFNTNNIIVYEDELVGIPYEGILSKDMIDLMMPDRSGLSKFEKVNLENIKDNMGNETPVEYRVTNVASYLIGFLLVVHSVLLLFGYILDSVNSFIDISFVSLLTFGALKLTPAEEYSTLSKKGKKGRITGGRLCILVVVIACIGVLFITGFIPTLIYKFVYMIESKLGS